MGEIAEMMLDGALCEGCGEFLDENGQGFPRYCAACGSGQKRGPDLQGRGYPARTKRDTPCPDCGKMCRGEDGVAEHRRTKHFPGQAARFCANFTTAQLEGRTLAEVVESAQAYIDAEMNVIGADYANDQSKLEDAMGEAVQAQERLQTLLNNFRSTGHDRA